MFFFCGPDTSDAQIQKFFRGVTFLKNVIVCLVTLYKQKAPGTSVSIVLVE